MSIIVVGKNHKDLTAIHKNNAPTRLEFLGRSLMASYQSSYMIGNVYRRREVNRLRNEEE